LPVEPLPNPGTPSQAETTENTPHPPTSPVIENTPQGGAGKIPAPSGRPRTLVMQGLLNGHSIKGLAVALGLNRATVQEHAARLLEKSVLTRVKRGQTWAWSKGPAYELDAVARGGAGSTRLPCGDDQQVRGRTPRIDVATDGARTFVVTRAPRDVTILPTFAGTLPKGRGRKQRVHSFRFTNGGREFKLLMDETVNDPTAWSLTVGKVSPGVPFEEFQQPGETPDDGWDRYVARVASAWCLKVGVVIDPTPRRTKPVSVTFPGTVPPGLKFGGGEATGDGTPPDPSGWNALELQSRNAERTRQQQEAHVALPETTATVQDLVAKVRGHEELLKACASALGTGAVVAAGLTQNVSSLLANTMAQAPPTIVARPSLPLPHEFV
jgi:hypothetical protein